MSHMRDRHIDIAVTRRRARRTAASGARQKFAPISKRFTTLIAERALLLSAAGQRQQVRVEIGQPVQDVETLGGLDWRCPVKIDVGGRTRRMNGLGVDSLQALGDAFKALEIGVAALERRTGGRLLFLDHPGHGLPQVHLSLPDVPRVRRRSTAGRATHRTARTGGSV